MKRKVIEHKMKFLLGAVCLVILVLLARVSYLQLVQTEQFRTLARNNYIRIVPVFAPRGEVFDRQGAKIVTNRPIYTVSINNLNLKGTTYHLYLHRTGADIVEMADTLAWVLAGDEETIRDLERSSGETLKDYAKDIGVKIEELKGSDGAQEDSEQWYTFKKQFIEAKIKDLARANKNQLEQGQGLEIAVVYNHSTVASLKNIDLSSFGLTLEKDTDALTNLVAMLLEAGVDPGQTAFQIESRVRQEINAKKGDRPYEPVLVADDIPPALVVALREKQMELPGVVVDVQPVRDYPHQELLTHTLGYVQSIKQEQYEKNKDQGYLLNDLYGQNGLELVYEKYLRGVHGARQVEVDALNRPVRDLGLKPAVPGNDLVLTIDLDLQQAAEKALAEWIGRAQGAGFGLAGAGSAVVMDVRTGAVLAMASYPNYHPGIFTGGLTGIQWQQLQDSGALINRVTGATYPPGSTFKMVTTAAILESNIVDPNHQINCIGYYKYGAGTFKDWKPGGHGRVDMRKALEVSCNPYFYHYGRLAGVDAIARYAREFGLGEKTGIDLPSEVTGVVPTPQWKYELVKSMLIRYHQDFARVRELNRQIEVATSESHKQTLQKARDDELAKQLKKHEWELNWQQYETINMSIGQGDNTYTPLQLVTYVSAIANNGTLYKPYLVEKIISPRNELIKRFKPEVRRKIDLDPKNMKIIQEGMHQVTLPPTGTGSSVFLGFPHGAAAKTGTTEVLEASGKKKGTHGLFVAYAPYEKPEVAVAVVVEFVDSGSGYAGPIARQILDAYFTDPDPSDAVDSNSVVSSPDAEGSAVTGGNNPADWGNHIAAIQWPGRQASQVGPVEAYAYGNLDLYQMLKQKQRDSVSAPGPVTKAPVQRVPQQQPQQPAPGPPPGDAVEPTHQEPESPAPEPSPPVTEPLPQVQEPPPASIDPPPQPGQPVGPQ